MLYLHCGWPRTGTSSLQTVLHENRRILASAGIVYPDKWRSKSNNPTHHGIYELVKASHDSTDKGIDEFKRFLALHSEDDVLLSAEGLTTSLVLNKNEALPRLLRAIRDITPVRCVWSLRRNDEVLCSLYLLRMRRGEELPPPARHFENTPDPERLFDGMQQAEAAVGGDAVYVKYDRDGKHQGELLRAFDIPDGIREAIFRELDDTRLNISLSHKQVVVLVHREALSARAGVELDAAALQYAFRAGRFSFAHDRRCELVGDSLRRDLRQRTLAAAQKQGFAPYVEFFGEVEINPSSPTPLESEAVTDEDLSRLMAHLRSTPATRR